MTALKLLLKIIDKEWDNITITFAQPWEVPWTVKKGERDDYEIYLLEKGKGRFVIDEKVYPVVKGDIMFFSTSVENSFIADETPFRFVFVTFKIENKDRDILELNKLLLNENSAVCVEEFEKIQELFYKIQNEFYIKENGYMFKIKLFLAQICVKMLELSEKNGSPTAISYNKNSHIYVNNIIIYLQKNYNKNISLDELAKLVNLHPRYLCTLFKQVSGKTLSGLLREIRIEKAKRLLLYTPLSITEIAMQVGFSDSQFFSRVFKNSEAISPSSYRKSKSDI